MNLRKGTVIEKLFIVDEKLGSGKCGSVFRAFFAEDQSQAVCLKVQTDLVRARSEFSSIQKFYYEDDKLHQADVKKIQEENKEQKGDAKAQQIETKEQNRDVAKEYYVETKQECRNQYNHFFTLKIEGKDIYIFPMPYFKGVTLEDFLKLDQTFSFELAKKLIISLIYQSIKLHQCGLLHRDLKPNNLIVMFEDKDNPQIKIIDLGGAVDFENIRRKEDLSIRHYFKKRHPTWDKLGLLNFIGVFSKQFAPEQLKHLATQSSSQIGRRSDNYAIGRVIQLIFKKCAKLTDEESVLSNHIITGLMDVDPLNRMSIEEALFTLDPAIFPKSTKKKMKQ